MPQVECGFPANPLHLVGLGPRLDVQIGLDVDALSSKAKPDLPAQTWSALIDTGATESCIDSGLATTLELPVVDRRTVSGALGGGEVNMHVAQIYIPSLDRTVEGLFAGVHLVAGGQPYAALIGRTFLLHYSMTYDGVSGSVTISQP